MKNPSANIYHYTECGLNNQYLLNGYEDIDTDYGPSVLIHNVEGLHYSIARSIVEAQPHITGREFKFVRKQMGLTQQKVAKIFGCDVQTVARWEKSGRVPRPADHFIRYLFLGVPITTSAEKLARGLPESRAKITLEFDNSDWRFEVEERACAGA